MKSAIKMTLIIGRVKDGKIYILGDSKLTFYNKHKTNPFVEGCLKQYLISDHLAVGFSGIREHFEQILPNFLACQSGQELAEIAQDAQTKRLDFDLLVGEVDCEKIWFVKNGIISQSEAGYIGDAEAFSAFQKTFHDNFLDSQPQLEIGRAQIQLLKLPEPVFDGEIYYRLYQSFKEVVWNPNITGVGGVIISLCTDGGRFRYLNYADFTTDLLNLEDYYEEPRSLEFGTTTGGGYSVEFCNDSPHGGQGRNTGFYFLQGGFGVVFPPNANGFRNAELVRAKNPAFWVLETKKMLGYGIGSQYLSESHSCKAGEELLTLERYEDALFCYELSKNSKSLKRNPAVYDRYLAGLATAMFNCGECYQAIAMLQIQIDKQSNFSRSRDVLNQMLQASGL